MAQHKTAITDDPAPHRSAPLPGRATSCWRSTARRGVAGTPRRTAARSTSRRSTLLGRIEVEVARIERAMDPPLV